MKYPIGTVLIAQMTGSRTPGDVVRATIIDYDTVYNEYRAQINFQLNPGRDYVNMYSEDVFDDWLADNWKIERSPIPCAILEDELFTL